MKGPNTWGCDYCNLMSDSSSVSYIGALSWGVCSVSSCLGSASSYCDSAYSSFGWVSSSFDSSWFKFL